MKAIMKSVSPRICEKVANGNCTILVSKTAPKCRLPFKCYIYCTSAKPYLYKEANPPFELFLDSELYKGKGYDDRLFSSKVIGEFVCDKVDKFNLPYPAYFNEVPQEVKDLIKSACLTMTETHHYLGQKAGYCWHISDLKIYDKPKELSEFQKPCKINLPMCDRCEYYSTWNGRCENIIRAPQSWCYVEELCLWNIKD